MDKINIEDEGGMISDALDSTSPSQAFVDNDAVFTNDGIMHWRDLVVYQTAFNDTGGDTDITGDCLVLAAQGEIYGPALESRDCLRIQGRGSDYNGMAKLAELNGLRTILENIIGT